MVKKRSRSPHALALTWCVAVASYAAERDLSPQAELVLQRGPHIELSAAVYSPDGQVIAAAGDADVIRLWDRESGDLVWTLPGHPERIVGLAFSPNGQLLASSSTDGSVKVWDYRAGKLLHLLTNHVGNWARRVAFSPDSRKLATATYDREMCIWDATTGEVSRRLQVHPAVDLVFSPDGRHLVTAGRGAQPLVQLWNVTSGASELKLVASNALFAVAVSADGRKLAVSSETGHVLVWALPSGELLRDISMPNKERASDIEFSPDGRQLAVSSQWVNRIFDAESGELLHQLHGHKDGTIQITFSPDGTEVATASSDASVRQWDARTGKLKRILAARPPDSPVTSIAFSADGRFEAVSGVDGVVRVWDARNGAFLYMLRAHEGPVHALAFSRDAAWLYSASADRTMRVWDMGHGTLSAVHPYFDRSDAMGVVSIGGRENLIATASGPMVGSSPGYAVKLWRSHYDRVLRVLHGHRSSVRAIAYATRSDRLVTASLDGVVKLWDSRAAKALLTITNSACAEAAAMMPDDSAVLLGLADGSVRVLKLEDLETVRQWPAHERAVRSIAIGGGGKWIATASADRSVAVWDWNTGALVRRFTNVTSQYLPLAFHAREPILAFAQRDEMVVHANVETGAVLFQRVHFPDGEWLAWNPAKAVYAASDRGDDHVRVRFAGQLTPVYPLHFYRSELRRTNLVAALAAPAPALVPKNFRLWWHRYSYKEAWLYAGLTLLGLWIGVRLRRGWVSERKRRLQENVSRQLLVSQEAERKRIAAELHDSLGQNLLIIKNRLYLAQRDAGSQRAEQLNEISQTVSQTIEEVREISHNLRPYQLDRLGLTKAVKAVVKKVAESGALKIESELAPIDGLFPPEGEINFYRIVQESLNNVLKHSGAASARINIARSNGTLTMSIEDDGQGFDYRTVTGDPEHPRGFGLTGLSERVRILGGRFQCDSAPGQGTRLTFEIPVPETTNGHE